MSDRLRQLKNAVKFALSRLDGIFMPAAASSRLSSSIYYLIKGTFSREQHAVLSGRLAYKRSSSTPSLNSSLLRRNIHRLEKGLIMRPRRSPFALDYIGKTVDAYVAASSSVMDPQELTWAHDVIEEYMRITPPHPVVDNYRKRFVEASADLKKATCEITGGKRIPYARSVSDIPKVDYDDLLALARYRRSVRWFLPDTVPRSAIDRAIEVAAYSPTACNRQPYDFRIFDEPELVSKAITIPMGTSGFSHQVPAVAIVVGKQRNYFSERDRHLIYVDGALAAMSFVYALECQGISSCCINWPDIESLERKMARFLRLDSDERPIMLIAFGYADPAGMVPSSAKKTNSTICKYNYECQ
ncbi:nitroreductase [Stenotrophomonas maltophilia]|uniref:Nitroreductase n=1 Tax=Stenotrophomonas maltophilia TaxID=40324 RepID=A0A246HLR9_STEMA|nr:nitroreductase [Stenotrophomonas maltophilia]